MSYVYRGHTGNQDLGPEEFRRVIWDDQYDSYSVDITDVGKYGGKWYIFRAVGCSCWSGDYDVESGPYETLTDLRAHVKAEYGNELTGKYYKEITDAWDAFFSENPDLV